jgi:replicative DNA helicase
MNTLDVEKAIISIVASDSQVRPDRAAESYDATRLAPSDFSSEAIGETWDILGAFLRAGQAVDIVAVAERAKASKAIQAAGGKKYLAELLLAVAPTRHMLPEYSRIVADKSLKRRAIDLLREVHKQLTAGLRPTAEALSFGADGWAALTAKQASLRTSEGDVLQYVEEAERALRGERVWCLPTGIQAIDDAIGGLQSSVLTMVGAYPGVGKSALLASMVLGLAQKDVKVGFFSLEDERLWVTKRWLALFSGVSLFTLATYRMSQHQQEGLADAAAKVYSLLRNVVIDDRPGMTPAEVTASAKDLILNHKCKAIFVDHLGEMRLERSDRYDLDVSEALASLRDVAKRYQVPVVVASHVRRRQGLTIDDAPSLTDFANSSAPERMARVALGLSRIPGGIRASVLKQTNGPSGQHLGLKMIEHAGMVSQIETLQLPQEET